MLCLGMRCRIISLTCISASSSLGDTMSCGYFRIASNLGSKAVSLLINFDYVTTVYLYDQ